MQVYGIIPVNRLEEAKSRLASALTRRERVQLLLCMLEDVLHAVHGLLTPVVVSPSSLKEHLPGEYVLIKEKEKRGLTEAVRLGNAYALERGADATVFLPADVPLIKRHHVKEVLELGRSHPLVVAPARKGGVALVYRRPPDVIPEVFSDRSFIDVQKTAERYGVSLEVYDSFYLSLDLDTPEDIREFMYHGRGTATYEFLSRIFRGLEDAPPG